MRGRLSSKLIHVLFAGFLLLGMTGSRLVFRSWYTAEFRRAGATAVDFGSRERERMWQRLPYVEFTNISLAEVFGERIGWEQLGLEQNQMVKLKARVAQLAEYLQNPSFEDYYRMRTEGITYRLLRQEPTESRTPNNVAQQLVSSQMLLSAQEGAPTVRVPPPEDRETIRLRWEGACRRRSGQSPPKITAVCATNIAAAITGTNTVISLVTGEVAKGFTVFVEHLNPGFVYSSQGSATAGPARRELFFHLSFYAKDEASDVGGPVYVSLQWLPKDQVWGLGGLITDKCLRIGTIF